MRNVTAFAWILSAVALGCAGKAGAPQTQPGDAPQVDAGNTIPGLGAASATQPVGAATGAAPVQQSACVTNREYLATVAWNGVLASKCQSCHGPGGLAEQQNADFLVRPAAYPGFIDENLTIIQRVSKNENDGLSTLLRKPTGELGHGGGVVIQKGSPEYSILEELVKRSKQPVTCDANSAVDVVAAVNLLDAKATFRKASLALNGRMPNAMELQSLELDGEAALPVLLSGLMTEDAFYTRLVEMFNDQWLTDRYLRDANGLLNDTDFPNARTYYDGLPDTQKEAARRSIAREPLELMAHIVRNERPFTEIVTADYTVLNSFTAPLFNNNDLGFTSADYSEQDWREGKIYVNSSSGMAPLPQAGILTSPIFLNRYPTSPTNRNRHRARIVLRELLATDILKVADRPIDPTSAAHYANPTREDPACKTCHAILDPIAGGFQKFDDNDQEHYLPNRKWHEEMFLPGFGDEQMLVSDYAGSMPWLGQHIAKDPRFALAMVRNTYQALIGKEPEDFPRDLTPGAYAGWSAQEKALRDIATAFTQSNYNLKVVIQAVILSPYFRADNTRVTDVEGLRALSEFGTGRLLSPEQLNRKVTATTGFTWMNGNIPALLDSYRLLYGGIDSDSVTERLTTPNGVMSGIMWRMATGVACHAVSRDFAQAQDKRLLFPLVTQQSVPENQLAEPDAAGKQAITDNLVYLYDRLLGETVNADSPELKRAYNLFLTTWREGRGKLAAQSVSRTLPYECGYRRDVGATMDLPEDQQLTKDDNYTVRSWMAVTTYMLSDFRFLYD